VVTSYCTGQAPIARPAAELGEAFALSYVGLVLLPPAGD